MKIINLYLLLALVFFTQLASAAPKIQHWTTDDGLAVYYVEVPQLPMLDMRIVFSAGSVRDNQQAGLAMLTSSMLDEGAGGLSVDELAHKFESVGANFSAGSARDMAWITLRTLTLQQPQKVAVDTWLKVLSDVNWPEKNFQRLKKQVLQGLEAEKQSPSAIANKAFFKHLYGEHPYASPSNGNEASIKAITIEQLKAFHQQYYVKQNAMLAIVGAVSKDEAEVLAKRVAASLVTGKKAADIPVVKPLEKAKTLHIPYPSKQAHIMIGQVGNKRGDKDYFTLYTGNHIFGGGGFTSRLMKEVRDARGLSYSVYSYFSPMQALGPFILGLQTKLSQTDEAVQVSSQLLKDFQNKGITEAELIAAKKDITGSFPLGVASNADIVQYLGMIGFYNLPLDYLDAFTNKVEMLSVADINKALADRIQSDKLLTVIVGGEAKAADGSEQKTEKAQSETKADPKHEATADKH
jgi:zinc protease